MSIKYCIMDYSNEGILYFNNTGDGLTVALQLKAGLVDSEIRFVYSNNSGYEKLNKNALYNDNEHLMLTSKTGISVMDLPTTSINPNYLIRKNLVKLRAPLMERLVNYTRYQARTCQVFLWEGFENNIHTALAKCDVEKNIWDNSILEYAYINEIEPIHAYRELLLQVEHTASHKMRIFSFFKKFTHDINNVKDEQEASIVNKAINDKFFRDTWV